MLPFFGLTLPQCYRANVSDTTVTGNAVTVPAFSEAGVRVGNDGKLYQRVADGGSYTFLGYWLNQPGTYGASLYEVRATVTSGSITTGSTGSYLDCSTSRDWTKRGSGTGGPVSAVVLLEFRRKGASAVEDSASFTLTIESTP